MSSVDPEYMSSLFLELPGIDPNDPEVQVILTKLSTEEFLLILQALLSKMKEDKEAEKKDQK